MKLPRMRFWSVAMALCLIFTMSAQQSLAANPLESSTTPTSDDSSINRYLVELRGEPVAAFARRIRPSKDAFAKFDAANPTVQNHTNQLVAQRNALFQQIKQTIGREPRIIDQLDVVFYGFTIDATAAEMRLISKLPNVVSYEIEPVYELTTDAGPGWIGADQIQDGSATGVFAVTFFGANLTPPVSSTLTGEGRIVLDSAGTTLDYFLIFSDPLVTEVTLVNTNDDSVITTLTSADQDYYTGSIAISPTEAALIESGDVLVVAHTAANPTGEAAGLVSGYKGEGVVVGIIDSGINSQHPSFAEVGGDGYQHLNPYGQDTFLGVCDPANAYYNPAFQCNNKLVGAWTFAATSVVSNTANGIFSPEDEDGHGSHTASTVAGNVINSATVGPFDFGRVSGVAPHANIIAYDVCGYLTAGGDYSASCPGGALYNAISRAILDGVDVINYSISGGDDPWTDPFEQSFLLAREYGVIVSASAGNEGPGSNTVAHVSPWLMSVAASTHNRAVQKTLLNINDGTDTLPDILGAGATEPLLTSTPIVDADALGNTYCEPFEDPSAVAGMIVLCERGGGIGRVAKSENVLEAGAAGFILMNDEPSGPSFISDAYVLPGILISYDDGLALRAWLAASTGTPTAQISATTFDTSASNGDKLASFSSRGPAFDMYANMLKPDIAAPGVDIVAAVAYSGGGVPDFDLYSGTSMAAPHAAGAAALLRGLLWDWTPGEIQSALIMTANSTMINHDGVSSTTPLDRGNGRIQVDQAVFAGLAIDEDINNFWDSIDTDGATIASLNVPSMATNNCVVSCTWSRTFRNTLGVDMEWNFSSESPGLTATPSNFTIGDNQTQTVMFTLDVEGQPIGDYVFNRAIFTANDPSLPNITLSVAALVRANDIPEIQDIESKVGVFTHDLTAFSAPYTSAEVTVMGLSKAESRSLFMANDAHEYYSVTVPTDTVRFVVDIRESPSLDLDLFIYKDSNDNGTLEASDPEVCMSATVAVLEYCSLEYPDPGQYIVEIHNYEASDPAAEDLVRVQTAVVPPADQGNLTIDFPATNATTGDITVGQSFNLPTSVAGDSWYGLYIVEDTSTMPATELTVSLIDFHHIWGDPDALTIVEGDNQSTEVGTAFAQPLTVELVDDAGNAIPNATISFTAPSSGASADLSSLSATTDISGTASITATANTIVGSYVVTASVDLGGGTSLDAVFNLTNTVGAVASLSIVAGDNQSTEISTAFTDALQVQAVDSYGNPVPNVSITFTAPNSGASAVLSANNATTGANGQASVNATANATAGSYIVTASSGSASVDFNLSNTEPAQTEFILFLPTIYKN
jgi:subtilisin family serine protease